MSELRLLLCIVPRELGDAYSQFFDSRGIAVRFSGFCSGTASGSVLDLLGLEKTEKLLFQAVVPAVSSEKLLRRLSDGMGIEARGGGIAMTVPITGMGGVSGLNYLTQGQNIVSGEVKKMNETMYSLIVAITNKGNTDIVMDAAREAGARGGTVFNARGTAPDREARFFGVSIGKEREIVYILTVKEEREAIMKAIMDKAGMHTEAHTALFSLPVDGVAGFHGLEPED